MDMYITLNSVGCVLDTETKLTHPQDKNGGFNKFNGESVHINECSDEWWQSLSYLDKLQVFQYKYTNS